VATPAGSAAYNYSAGGPVLPLSAHAHALAICPISPRRWPGAVLPAAAQVRVDVLERDKRPVSISADTHESDGVISVEI
jgi:NAD+ kinase